MSVRSSQPFIPFARPSFGPEEQEAVLSVMRSGWLTTGEEASRFETECARYVAARYALALNSATAGLHLCLEALGVGPGSVVLTTPYTFAATAEVARYLGADPVFTDIEEDTLNIDPAALERTLDECAREGRKVSGIVPVHVAGLLCDMEAICSAAARAGVPVVEDSAHAFPVRKGGRFAGTMGDAGVYSFYATKPITTGEGGMVVTDREDIARRVRLMRLHGIDRDVWDRYTTPGASWKYDVVEPGYKYNMTDIAAAIGRVQLGRAEGFLERRRRIARAYVEGLSGLDFLRLPRLREDHGWHLFILRIRDERLMIDRDGFIEELNERGIGASVHYIPLHIMSYYRKRYGYRPEDFPVSLRCYQSSISIPLYPSLSEEEVARVISAITETGKRHYRPI